MRDLELLLEKVRTAEAGSRELDGDFAAHFAKCQPARRYTDERGDRWVLDVDGNCVAIPPVTTSIDAIVALIERELPGLVVKATKIGDGSGHWQIQEAWMGDIEVVYDFSPMEPRPGALAFAEVLLAALSQQTGSGETEE